MRSTTLCGALACVAIVALPALASAQTVAARADVVTPCNGSAPADSLYPLFPAQGSGGVWMCNEDDYVAIEVEAQSPAGDWVFEADSNRPGFSGAGYFRWNGPNLFSTPGRGVMTYKVFIANPGTYQVRIHNRHDNSDPSEENDCWIRVNCSSWIKAYSNNGRNSRVWNWHFRFDPGHGPVQYPMNRGVNEIQISGRSSRFMIDRIHVFRQSFPGENLSLPASERIRRRPVIGATDFTVAVGDPNDEANLTPGQTVATVFQSLSPAGSNGCGQTIPGFGPGGGDGELLIGTPAFRYSGLRTWNGPSTPALIPTSIPNDQALVGLEFWIQGVLWDQARSRAVLTDGMKLVIGAF